MLKSCTGGIQAGDLVSVNFAVLGIVDGESSMKMSAQLAKSPLGDFVGGGVIPPMPTFWGGFNSCVPAPVKGKVVTTTPGCANQIAEANQIVTDYVNKVNHSDAASNFIVLPKPERAFRHGTGLPDLSRPSPASPTAQSNDLPFDNSGHLNPGGDFDAYWRLNGDLNTSEDSSTGNSATHFDGEFSAHVVLFGQDANVVSLQATVDTTSGQSPGANGSVHMFLFGIELPGGGSADASTGFNFNISQTQEFNVVSVHYWIFAVEAGATATAGVNTTGTLAATGFSLSVTPQVAMGAHIFGGVDVGIASGGVDARIDLLDVTAPVTAQAGWSINTLPQNCSLTVSFALNGDVTISSLGGEIDLVATFGDCPFCFSVSDTLLIWSPVASTTQNLFSAGPTTLAALPLPQALCPLAPFSVTIQAPTSTVPQTLPQQLFATANNSVGVVNCTWTGFLSGDTPPSPQGCAALASFGNLGPRTLTVQAVNTVPDQFGRQLSQNASASQAIDVSNLPPGDYITGTNPAQQPVCSALFGCTIPQPPFNNQTLVIQVPTFPASISLSGEVIPSLGTNTVWTATDSSGSKITIPPPTCFTICLVGGNPDENDASWSVQKPDIYTVAMTTTDSSGHVVGTASMMVNVQGPPR